MKKTNKRGFTIVELVIVIAVIAILAAVLIPTFTNVINKANQAKDTQLVRNLNTSLKLDVGVKHNTMQDALDAVAQQGYDLDKINASAMQAEILWDSHNDAFVYLDGEGNINYLPEIEKDRAATELELWQICKEMPEAKKYSIYAGNGWNIENIDNLSVGFDAGKNANIKSINYVNSDSGQSVVIRTNSYETELVVNAENDTVKHFDKVGTVHVIAVDPTHCYEENGKAAFTQMDSGKYKTTETAEVELLYVSDSVKVNVAVVPGTVNHAHAFDITEAVQINATNPGVTFDYDENAAQNELVDVYHHVSDAEDLPEGQEVAPKMEFTKPEEGATEEQIKAAFEHNKNVDEVKAIVEEAVQEEVAEKQATCAHEFDENNTCVKCGYCTVPAPVGVAIHNQEELEAFANGTLSGLSDAEFQGYLAADIDLTDNTHIVFNDNTLSLTLDLYGHHVVGNWKGVRALSGGNGQTEGLFNLKAGSLIVKDTIETGYIENLYHTTTAEVSYDINTIGFEGIDTVVLFGTSQFELQSGSIINNQKHGSAILVHSNNNVLTISGGLVKGDLFGVSDNGSTMIVKGGTIQGYTGVYRLAGNMTMTKGNIEGEYIGLKTNGYSVSNSAGYAHEFTYTISGGTIKGDTYSVYVSDNSGSYKYKEHAILKLSGGEYISEGNYAISATNIDIRMQVSGGKYKANKAVFSYISEKNLWCNASSGSDNNSYSWRTASNIEYLATKGFVFDETKTREENWENLKATILNSGSPFTVQPYSGTTYSDGNNLISIKVAMQTVYDSFVVAGKTINQVEAGLWSVQ